MLAIGSSGNRVWIAVLTVGAAFALAAALAGSAAAQQPAVCDQYPQLPQCQQPTAGGDGLQIPGPSDQDDEDRGPIESAGGPSPGDGGGGPLAGAGGPVADVGDDARGELPFTGYPLTPLILLFLVLLAAGLAIRAYIAARERWRARHAGAGAGYAG